MKVFQKNDTKYICKLVSRIYDQWAYLLEKRETISFLLWVADGSELLDYTGNLEKEIEWACFAGNANNPTIEEGEDPGVDLHEKNVPYLPEVPKITYRVIQRIAAEFKAEGKKRYPHTNILVGTTFDIGPEFAKSDFKYHRHTEICTGTGEGGKTFINSYGELAADHYPYAGFPEGIPDKTPFGTFLGRQTQVYLQDLHLDYLWLSNGVGFSATPWHSTGEIFDGEYFYTEKIREVEDKVFSFWENFRQECPDFPIYTRGTNFSAGIDYATDAVGLYRIYNSNLNIMPPPNSPWAAINGNYGLELMGHMTRNCELPGDRFLFRYYLHDPWWVNSPWYDRYGGNPHDIYLPMALSRIDESGKTQAAEVLNILSLDNTMGDMPEACVYETIPHFLKAEKDSPDEAAPFVWVYPFREYTTATTEKELMTALSGDLFICRAMITGFPLSSIVSCDNFLKHEFDVYRKSVLVTPVPGKGTKFETKILDYVKAGGKVLFYGAFDQAGDEFIKLFGLAITEGIIGEVQMDENYLPDANLNGVVPGKMIIREDVCNGSLNSILREASLKNQEIRAGKYVLTAEYRNAVWYRAPIGLRSLHYLPEETYCLDNPNECMQGEVLLRKVLEKFGYHIGFRKLSADSKLPLIMMHRSNNADIFSVYAPDLTVETLLKCPLGAPVLLGYEVELREGKAVYHFPKAEHGECRVYVEQKEGIVGVKEMAPVSMKYRRRIEVSGLKNATLRFFGEKYCEDQVNAAWNAIADKYTSEGEFEGEMIYSKEFGTYYEVRNVTGRMLFSMPYKNMNI